MKTASKIHLRGFASMDKKRLKEVTSQGGKRLHELGKGHYWDSVTARIAGRKGGLAKAKKI